MQKHSVERNVLSSCAHASYRKTHTHTHTHRQTWTHKSRELGRKRNLGRAWGFTCKRAAPLPRFSLTAKTVGSCWGERGEGELQGHSPFHHSFSQPPSSGPGWTETQGAEVPQGGQNNNLYQICVTDSEPDPASTQTSQDTAIASTQTSPCSPRPLAFRSQRLPCGWPCLHSTQPPPWSGESPARGGSGLAPSEYANHQAVPQ